MNAQQHQPAEGREQNQPVRQLGIAADQDRAQQVVGQTDHRRAKGYQDNGRHDFAGRKQIDGHRHPHHERPHGGQQRQNAHHHTPQQRCGDAQHPEDEPAQRPLHRRHHQRTANRGPGGFDKLSEQQLFALGAQRNGLGYEEHQLATVAEQEEGQVQHQQQLEEEAERALPEHHGVLCDETAHHDGAFRQAFTQAVDVDIELVEDRLHRRQRPLHQVDILPGLPLTALNALIHADALTHQRRHQDQHRYDQHHQPQQQGHAGGHIGPLAPRPGKALLHRVEQHGDHHRPEHRREERCEKPQEEHCGQRQHQQEGALFKLAGHHASAPSTGRTAVVIIG